MFSHLGQVTLNLEADGTMIRRLPKDLHISN
jgi:hypothetical protein